MLIQIEENVPVVWIGNCDFEGLVLFESAKREPLFCSSVMISESVPQNSSYILDFRSGFAEVARSTSYFYHQMKLHHIVEIGCFRCEEQL